MADINPAQRSETRREKKPQIYPAPFIVSPTAPHTQSILFLHGLGSNGEKFGLELLASNTADGKSLQDHFPGMKFIFPTAKKRRAKSYNRALINQWFDNAPVSEQSNGMSRDKIEWQLEGLKGTAEFLFPVLDEEVRSVGAKNVFLAGLSQGCAMGLHLLLSYQPKECEGYHEGRSLAGFVGMCGWLPFAEDIQELIRLDKREDMEEEDKDDPFATSDVEDDGVEFASDKPHFSSAMQVCNFVRENMEMPSFTSSELPCLRTLVFLGHGKSDDKVTIDLGREAAMILKEIGMQVRWEEYDEGHWYKVPEQIDSLVDFLKTSLGAAT
jgi:predicted esterase